MIAPSLQNPTQTRVSRPGIEASLYNFTQPNFNKWNKALHRARIGEADARILCVGDSTTRGYPTGPSIGYPKYLAARLNSSGYAPAAEGLSIADQNESLDTRWTKSGWSTSQFSLGVGFGWSPGLVSGGSAGFYESYANGNTLTYTPGVSCDTFKVSYWWVGGLSTGFTIQATGGGAVTVNSGSNGWNTASCTAGSISSSNVLTITALGSANWIFDAEARLSGTKQVLVGNAGYSSSTMQGWGTSIGTNAAGAPRQMIQNYAPDLVLIDLAINDASVPRTTAQVLADLQTLLPYCQANGDVILKTMTPSGGSVAAQGVIERTYRDAFLSLGLPVIDLYGHLGNGDPTAFTNYKAVYMSDDAHSNKYGYGHVGALVAEALRVI